MIVFKKRMGKIEVTQNFFIYSQFFPQSNYYSVAPVVDACAMPFCMNHNKFLSSEKHYSGRNKQRLV